MQLKLSDIEKKLGALVRFLRKSRCMTLEEFSRACGFCIAAQMQRYEVGKNHLKFSHILRIAEVLEVPIEVFFSVADVKSSEQYNELISSFFSIRDPSLKKTLLVFMKSGSCNKKVNNNFVIDEN